MRYVILRDDDTNALTPPECLDRLYRPFLERGLPVNLAVIPRVRTRLTTPNGEPEGFLPRKHGGQPETVPLARHPELIGYLKKHAGFHLVQHGCFHDTFEFDRPDVREIRQRLDEGARCLAEAGFAPAHAFVAPHDKLSRASFREVARRFPVLSTGWFEWRRLPPSWWPAYLVKKLLKRPHWRVGRTLLLSHPGCLLSYHRPYDRMLEQVQQSIASRRLTVLVTHWWEYFRNGRADEPFIQVLHQVSEFLASQPDIRVVTFEDLAAGRVALEA